MYNIKKENTKVEIDLSIDSAEWEKGVQSVYESTKGKFNIEGFRKGHAPRKVIEQLYGDSVFFEDTVDKFVNEALNDVLDKNPELEPVAMPTTQFESFTADGGLKMKIFFEIVPDFKLPAYKDVTIKVHSNEVTDEDVEHQIHHLLEDNAKFVSVDREIKNGDSALIDFTGYINGEAFDGGRAMDYPLEIGSHSFIDNFEDQLIGHKKGEEVDVNVTFPEDYQAEEFKGKKALFKVTVKDVREKSLPTLDDKFVADTTEFETVDEYKKDLKAHIQDMKDQNMENEFEYNMRDYLLKNTKIEIPQVMIDNSVEDDIKRMRDTLAPYKITLEDYLKQTGGNFDDYKKNMTDRAVTMIKTRYIYRKLLEENKITVSAKELEDATKGMKESREIVRKENELLLNKLHKFLRENNKLEIVNVQAFPICSNADRQPCILVRSWS